MYEIIKSIARSAGPLFMEGYTQIKSISYKCAVDLVTDYDVMVELFLKEKLSLAFPDYALVGEETSDGTVHPDKAIYIDPIDGTTNFVHGIPFCAVSIGIWEGGEAVAGVVYNPVLDELFYAEKGKGAFCNGEALHVSPEESLERSLMATGFPYTKIEQGEDFRWAMKSIESILPYTRDIRRLGSASLDLCNVARGNFEGYFEINLKPWDVAAGVLMVTEAGGSVSREDGGAYRLGGHVIVASNGRIQKEIIAKLG